MPRRIATVRKKPQMFLVVGVTMDNNAYNMMDKCDSEEAAIKTAGEFAHRYDERNGYRGVAVYELKGIAKRPKTPVNFVTIQSMEVENGPSKDN